MKHTGAALAGKFPVYPAGRLSNETALRLGTPFRRSETSRPWFQCKLSEKTHPGKSYGKVSDAFKLICTLCSAQSNLQTFEK